LSPAELRQARKRLGLTQKGLAEALRMGTHGWQTVSKWESDRNERGVPGPVAVAIEMMLGPPERIGEALWRK
jgi:DNA-binding transcriptional regulator YiaG